MDIRIFNHNIRLLPEKALWIASESMLVVSDVHLGKITHFRKSGIPLPVNAKIRSLERLRELVQAYSPKTLVLLGDFFHSEWNSDWEIIASEISTWKIFEIILVGGNHDVLSMTHYKNAGILLKPELRIGQLLYTHEALPIVDKDVCNVAGHLHPAVFLSGKGRQRVRLSCFVHTGHYFYLPAFGDFTGHSTIRVKKSDKVYVIADEKVVEI